MLLRKRRCRRVAVIQQRCQQQHRALA
jgi:hypothetical protein